MGFMVRRVLKRLALLVLVLRLDRVGSSIGLTRLGERVALGLACLG